MSGTPALDDQTTPYQQPVEAVLASLATDAQHGLSEAEARVWARVRHRKNRWPVQGGEPCRVQGWRGRATLPGGAVGSGR
jgi:hypothetical protein